MNDNYTNPFYINTTIEFQIPISGNEKLSILDELGSVINILLDEYKLAGNYCAEFDANKLPANSYFYYLHAGEYKVIKKRCT